MIVVHPSRICGTVRVPPSKSLSQRAVFAALLVGGVSTIENAGCCGDLEASVAAARALGADIYGDADRLLVAGGRRPAGMLRVPCGESAFAFRVAACLAAFRAGQRAVVEGSGTLLRRSMRDLSATLTSAGVAVQTRDGRPPISLLGSPLPLRMAVEADATSQVVSGLLFAAAASGSPFALEARNLRSRPYALLTADILLKFGFNVEVSDNDIFTITPPALSDRSRPFCYCVEGDWSAAAMMLVAGAVAGRARVVGLDTDSLQPDRAVLEVLAQAGAVVEVSPDAVEVGNGRLRPFAFDAIHCPDLFMPLTALAAHCPGTSSITGLGRISNKESDRGAALRDELGAVGVEVELRGDTLLVHGGAPRGGCVDSRGDHRLAMACAVAALGASSPVEIRGAAAVAKSYPSFFDDLRRLRADIAVDVMLDGANDKGVED